MHLFCQEMRIFTQTNGKQNAFLNSMKNTEIQKCAFLRKPIEKSRQMRIEMQHRERIKRSFLFEFYRDGRGILPSGSLCSF